MSRTYLNCQNRVYTATSIIQHVTTLGVSINYPHCAIGKYLQNLNDIIIINKTVTSTSSVARTSSTVPIDITYMTESGTITLVAHTTSVVPI